MCKVTELRARLKATSTAFQTRENSVAELREAVQTLTLDLRAGQEKARAQSRKLEQQVTTEVIAGLRPNTMPFRVKHCLQA